MAQFQAAARAVLAARLLAFLPAVAPLQAAPPEFLSDPAVSPQLLFVGEEARFSAEARDPEGQPLEYRWRFGDSSAGTAYGPASAAVHRYGAPNTYRASVYVRNRGGEYAYRIIPVTVHTRPTPVRPSSSSTLALDTLRERLWCVNPDHGSVAALDLRGRRLLFEIPTGADPRSVARAADGTLWVANRGAATVTVHDGADGRRLATLALPYGSRPHGLAFAPAGDVAYLALEGSGRLLRLDAAARRVTGGLDLGPTPRAVAVSGDGRRILVTRFLSPRDHAEVWEVSAEPFAKARTFTLAHDESVDTETGGSGVLNYLASVAISPDGSRAVVSASKANTRRGARLSGTDLSSENTVRTAIAWLDLAGNREDPGARNDFDNASLAMASAFSPMGELLFTALAGSNAVHARLPHHNGAVIERNKAVGAAPLGLLVDPRAKVLYVQAWLDRSITAWDFSPHEDPDAIAADSVASRFLWTAPTAGWEPLAPEVLRGKRLFHDAADPRLGFNGYLACASCHFDGGSDGRVWDFTGRGEGLRRTTSLLGRAGLGHGPVHWSANFDEIQDFENDIRGPFGGTGLMADGDFHAGTRALTLGDPKAGRSADLDALAAYVASLARVEPSPHRNPDGTLTADAGAGRALFLDPAVGCARCHVPGAYTDSRLPSTLAAPPDLLPGDFLTPEGFLVHDVGTLKPTSGARLGDTLRGLDTPTLKGLRAEGPFLHDGSAATLDDVLGAANPDDRHGRTSHLSRQEKDRLIAFLLQLDDGPAPPVGLAREGRVAVAAPRLDLALGAGSVRIRLTGGPGGARLLLHDLRGRRVADLGPGRAEAGGMRTWTWDGRAGHGRAVGGGRPARGMYALGVIDGAGRRVLTAAFPWLP